MARTQIKSGGFIQDPSLAYSVSVSLHNPTKAVSALLNTGPFSNAAAGYSAWENAPHANVGLRGRSLASISGTALGPGGADTGVSVWTGSAWVDKPIRVWTGSVWTSKPLRVWNGSAWI